MATQSCPQYDLHYFNKVCPIGPANGVRVVEDLAAGMPEFNVKQYYGSQPSIFVDYDHVVVAQDRETSCVIGLFGARWLRCDDGTKFLYLWTAMIADQYRAGKLFKRMFSFFFAQIVEEGGLENFPQLVVTKTYNPVVYSLIHSFAANEDRVRVYPTIPATSQSEAAITLARKIARAISPQLVLDEQSGKVVGGQAMVAPDFFPRMEMSNSAAVNQHFATQLTRNDQILCILQIPDASRPTLFERAIGRRAKERKLVVEGAA